MINALNRHTVSTTDGTLGTCWHEYPTIDNNPDQITFDTIDYNLCNYISICPTSWESGSMGCSSGCETDPLGDTFKSKESCLYYAK